jgi:hypothetical protein
MAALECKTWRTKPRGAVWWKMVPSIEVPVREASASSQARNARSDRSVTGTVRESAAVERSAREASAPGTACTAAAKMACFMRSG